MAISPIDGRYHDKSKILASYFSEFALIKYRILVEIEYFIALSKLKKLGSISELNKFNNEKLRGIYQHFTLQNAEEIKHIETTTNHDVKAVEYFLRNEFDKIGYAEDKEWIHFGLTSQDINNTAIPLLIQDYIKKEYLAELSSLIEQLTTLANQYNKVPMLAKTHGQPATPTILGKEIMVFAVRLENQQTKLRNYEFSGKFGGATGNMNAHFVGFPNINWNDFAASFMAEIGLVRNYPTTQIDHYDNLAELFDQIRRINVILIDLVRDVWSYISMDYFKQKTKADEVGSSAMPHKVNPIDFENAEGNLMMANAFLDFLSNKLPVSRLQRDLTDSTVLRNVGVPFAHTSISMQSISKGLTKLELNQGRINDDLQQNWAVVAEGIQTILRRENYPDPYNALKHFSRGKGKLNQSDFIDFINSLQVNQTLKDELLTISPFNYTGIMS